ncbi:hypothetical protein AKJ65_01320 [candidate division MSBL1 archaeon SCGC-AAA259E19]|uniref:Uncharacterized protein n=1 Tax=candidate division MSBL1 archaeon SCGC-AAA259E19 TaxID=1698264 RepID=A0A133UNA7_9EURY|nr:hypothetical protein AKJ65_01320 [candidate division MSBL1 archaeon SCGC-AAA259E19]
MARLKVTKTFERGGDTYEEGKTYIVGDEMAEWAEEKGYGSRPTEKTKGETPKLQVPQSENVWKKLKRRAKSGSDKPPDWNPKKGDWLLGTVNRTGEGENNRFAAIEVSEKAVRAKRRTGEDKHEGVTVEVRSEVLLWEVKDLSDLFDKIRAGSKIAVQYTGEIKTSEGHRAKLYDYAVEQ